MHAPKYRRPSGERTMSTIAFLRHKWMHFDSAHNAIREWSVLSFFAVTWRTTYVLMHNWIRFDRAMDESKKPNSAVHHRQFIAYLPFAWIESHPKFVQNSNVMKAKYIGIPLRLSCQRMNWVLQLKSANNKFNSTVCVSTVDTFYPHLCHKMIFWKRCWPCTKRTSYLRQSMEFSFCVYEWLRFK